MKQELFIFISSDDGLFFFNEKTPFYLGVVAQTLTHTRTLEVGAGLGSL